MDPSGTPPENLCVDHYYYNDISTDWSEKGEGVAWEIRRELLKPVKGGFPSEVASGNAGITRNSSFYLSICALRI